MKATTLTPTQAKKVTVKLRLAVEFIQDALKKNPEIWNSSSFRCALEIITEANTICNDRVNPHFTGEEPTMDQIRKTSSRSNYPRSFRPSLG